MVHLITDFGDSALLVPASALLLFYLLYLRSGRTALIWASTLALCGGLTIVLKIGFHACGAELPFLDMRSPSGHTSFSTTFYSCCALVIAANKDRWTQTGVLLLSITLVAAIAASRVVLEAHTISEVATGLAVGLLCVGWFSWGYLNGPAVSLRFYPFAGIALALAIALHGQHLNPEGFIMQIARVLQSALPACA
jgi:membrane-associated phospholipid phosphatase